MDKYNDFISLYEFLRTYEKENIITWLEKSWTGKDKQESLLRLFSKLNLISKLYDYDICDGNFNLNTIHKSDNITNIFYDDENISRKLKDNGDSSDLTCISKDKTTILAISSKNLTKYNIGKLDIEKISSNIKQYSSKYEKAKIGLCVRSKDGINTTIINAKESSKKSIKDYLDDISDTFEPEESKSYRLFF